MQRKEDERHFQLAWCQHSWRGVVDRTAFQRSYPSILLVPLPCPALSLAHMGFVLS